MPPSPVNQNADQHACAEPAQVDPDILDLSCPIRREELDGFVQQSRCGAAEKHGAPGTVSPEPKQYSQLCAENQILCTMGQLPNSAVAGGGVQGQVEQTAEGLRNPVADGAGHGAGQQGIAPDEAQSQDHQRQQTLLFFCKCGHVDASQK